ncbi:MAG: sulfotransferase [Anaerolineales bacterium]
MRPPLIQRVTRKLGRIGATTVYRITGRWDEDFNPIFVCGASGAGTSLLRGLLDQNFDVAASLVESARSVAEDSTLYVGPAHHYGNIDEYLQALYFPSGTTVDQVREDSLSLYRRFVRHPKRSSVVIDKSANSHLVRAEHLAAAFPPGRFILILRNPITTIEGFRRKWHLFMNADLTELCDFWLELHRTFLQQSVAFSDRVIGLTFDDLMRDSVSNVQWIGQWADLAPRREKYPYQDESNKPGRGLRNVVQGEIRVDESAEQDSLSRISASDKETIQERIGDTYQDLIDHIADWKNMAEKPER